MKNILFSLLLLFSAQLVSAQDFGLYWKYKDYDGAIALTVPGFVVHVGSWFVDDRDERKFIQKIGKVRVLVFEDGSPIRDRDMRRFLRKAKRRHLEELVVVRDGHTNVRVLGKERNNGNGIRKLVFFVDSPEDGFALISVRGRLRYDDISKILNEYSGRKNGEPVNPVIKVPTTRI